MRRIRLVFLVGLALLVAGVAGSARAQVPPDPTTPTTTSAPDDGGDGTDDPDDDGSDGEISPVFELLGPIAWPACEDAVAVMLTLPEVPSVTTEDGPVYVLCGMFTEPDGRQTCAVDKTGQDVIGDGVADLLGIDPPATAAPTAMAYGTVIEVRDEAPPPAELPVDLVATLGATFGCVPADTDSADVNPAPPPPSFPRPSGPIPPGTFAPTFTAPSAPLVVRVAPGLAAPIAHQDTARSAAASTRFLRGPNFAYPVVFAVPLLLLALGSYLGLALSRPIPSRYRATP